jgi:hypothetical protein
MISVTKLRRKPRQFRAFTGVSVAEFDQLLSQVLPAYEADQQRRKKRPGPPGAPEVGHPFRLPIPERLLMGLMYLRLYLGQNLLSYLFDLDQSNVSRELNDRLLPILLVVLPVPLRDAPLRQFAQDKPEAPDPDPTATGPKRRRIQTRDELFAAHPEIQEVLIDATEQSLPQPADKTERKLRYSGKQQDHTVKTQILGTRDLILHVFGALPGCIRDQTLLGASGVIRCVPFWVTIRLDKGYEGTDKRHPDRKVAQPVKGQRNRTVTALGRAYNYYLSTQRIYVEHHFARLQQLGILGGLYRGRFAAHEDVFCIVSGLLNFRATGRFSLA